MQSSRSARWGLRLAILGAAVLVIAVAFSRFGIADFRLVLLLAAVGTLVAFIGALLSLVGVFRTGGGKKTGRNGALAGLAIGVVALILPVNAALKGFSVPPVHDITTDLQNPPAFVALVAARGDMSNSLERPADLAQLQQYAYPDVMTLMVPAQPGQAFEAALDLARARGWEIAASVPAEGRIEATETTMVMGFKDDIVIRVSETETGGAAIDIRSVSRVGESDLGANAQRIRAFLGDLKIRLGA